MGRGAKWLCVGEATGRLAALVLKNCPGWCRVGAVGMTSGWAFLSLPPAGKAEHPETEYFWDVQLGPVLYLQIPVYSGHTMARYGFEFESA